MSSLSSSLHRRSAASSFRSSSSYVSESDSDSEVEAEEKIIRTANTKLAEKIAGIPSHSSVRFKCKRCRSRLFFSLLFFTAAVCGAMLALVLHFSVSSHSTGIVHDRNSVKSRTFSSLSESVPFPEYEILAGNGTTPAPSAGYYSPTVDSACETVPFKNGQWICKEAYSYPGQGYYLGIGSSSWPNPYPWPANVSGTLIPEVVLNTTCNNYTVVPAEKQYDINGTYFFCHLGNLSHTPDQGPPPYHCANNTGILIFNETSVCTGALVSEFGELECNGTVSVFSPEIKTNCSYFNYTVFVPPAPTNLLCNETGLNINWNFVVGEFSPPICMVIATPDVILQTTWRPVVDAFAVLHLDRSVNRTEWFHCSAAIAIEVGGVSSGPRARFDQGDSQLSYTGCKILVPFWTIIIHLDGGTVTEIEWDNECSSCNSVSNGDSCVMGNCGVTFDQCIEGGGITDCNIKVYVSWTGTDSNGNTLVSSRLRLSQFQQFSLSSSWSQATNWGGYNLPSLPQDNGLPNGRTTT